MSELEKPELKEKKVEAKAETPKKASDKPEVKVETKEKPEVKEEFKNDKKDWVKGRGGRRYPPRKSQEELTEEHLSGWVPQTKLGHLIREGKIKNIDEIIDKKMKILEPEIVDSLIRVEHDLLFAGQAKGKFGGGKRRAWRQSQKKTKEGNVITFSSLVIIGDKKGHVGLGFGKAKETLPAREKALRKAKLNIQRIKRGSGSFDGSSTEPHSIPFKVEGKCGSVRIKLIPAPQGTGLVIGDEGKKILKLVGIEDIYSMSFGQTGTTLNYAKAIMDALGKLK